MTSMILCIIPLHQYLDLTGILVRFQRNSLQTLRNTSVPVQHLKTMEISKLCYKIYFVMYNFNVFNVSSFIMHTIAYHMMCVIFHRQTLLTPEKFRTLSQFKCLRAVAEPGEPVGLLAAQVKMEYTQ